MSKLNLMDEIQGMDVENFETVSCEALDFESMMAMEIEEAEFQAQAEETQEAVEAFEEASEIAVEVQEEIQETLENIDEMTPVAVGKALGAIAEKASELVDVAETAVDAEAMDADFKAGARLELEAISDSIKKAWEAVKNFFRSVWAKIKQLIHNVGLWVVNGEKKTKAVRDSLNKKSKKLKNDELNSDEALKLAERIIKATGVLSGVITLLEKKDMKQWLDGLTDMSKQTDVDTIILNAFKSKGTDFTGVPTLDSDSKVKVVRLDGNNLKVVVLKTIDGTTGYSGYASIGLQKYASSMAIKAASVELKNLKDGSLVYNEAIDFLKKATFIQSKIKTIKDSLYKEMSEVGKQVDGDVEKVKFDQGFFKMVWSNTLGKKSAEQLTAEEKVRLVRNRASFTSKYTFDVLYGLHGLANGVTKAAAINVSLLEDK